MAADAPNATAGPSAADAGSAWSSGLSVRWLTLPPGHRFSRHAHSDWSVAVVRAGAGYIRCPDRLYAAPPGSVTVLHPGEVHDGWVHQEEGLDYVVVSVPEGVAVSLFCGAGTPFFHSRVVEDAGCAAALRAAYRPVGDVVDDLALLRREQLLVSGLGRLYGRHARGGRRRGRVSSALVRRALDHIDQHYRDPVTLSELALLAQVSVPTLLRRFGAEVGMPPYEYVVSRRVDVARDLLANGVGIAEAATCVGFSDQSHLHRHFARIVGVTPGRFRRGG